MSPLTAWPGFNWLRRIRPRRGTAQRARLLTRYRGRILIVHRGFEPDWLDELFKLPGGAGYFRIDARQAPGKTPTPVEWLVHDYLLPLDLPLPLLVQVRDDALRVRHLTDAGRVRHPSEIAWMLDELETRHHAMFCPDGDGFRVERGIAVEDNAVEMPYDFSL